MNKQGGMGAELVKETRVRESLAWSFVTISVSLQQSRYGAVLRLKSSPG